MKKITKKQVRALESATIQLTNSQCDDMIKSGLSGLTPSQRAHAINLLKEELKVAKSHFKTDGWDLNFDLIKSFFISDLIGSIGDAILATYVKAGYSLKSGPKGLMIYKPSKTSKRKSKVGSRSKS